MSSDVSERPNFDEILQLVDELDVESWLLQPFECSACHATFHCNGLDEKLEDAHELLQSYESMMRRGLPDTPLMHFINFLIKVSFWWRRLIAKGSLDVHRNTARMSAWLTGLGHRLPY